MYELAFWLHQTSICKLALVKRKGSNLKLFFQIQLPAYIRKFISHSIVHLLCFAVFPSFLSFDKARGKGATPNRTKQPAADVLNRVQHNEHIKLLLNDAQRGKSAWSSIANGG